MVINGQTSLLFILYIDDLHHSVTDSTLKIFADDVTIYKVVTGIFDCHVLQEDFDSYIFLGCCLAGTIEFWKM